MWRLILARTRVYIRPPEGEGFEHINIATLEVLTDALSMAETYSMKL